MLSRVADALYWMSRYMERTDSNLRMLKTNYMSAHDDVDEFTWRPVLRIFSSMNENQISQHEKDGRKVLHYMVLDRDNENSIYNLVTLARENARAGQDNITIELWQSLNEFYHIVRQERLLYS